MNKAILMGRLTRDPEVRYTQGDNPVCIARYTLAVDRRFSRDNGEGNNADFIPCVAFGKSGEFAEKYLKKGTKLAVTGRIQTGSYTNREGVKVYTTEVVVEDQEFAESKSASSGGSNGGNSNNGYGGGYGNDPQNGGQRGQGYGGGSYGNGGGNVYSQGGSYGGSATSQNSYGAARGNAGGYSGTGNNANGNIRGGAMNGAYQQSDLDGFMNIPDGIDEELPFA